MTKPSQDGFSKVEKCGSLGLESRRGHRRHAQLSVCSVPPGSDCPRVVLTQAGAAPIRAEMTLATPGRVSLPVSTVLLTVLLKVSGLTVIGSAWVTCPFLTQLLFPHSAD